MIALSVAKLKIFRPESEISFGIKRKKTFLWFGSISKLRDTRKGKKCFCDEPASV